MAPAAGADPRWFLAALLLAAVFGALSAFWANLHIYYEYGAATAKSRPWITSVGQAPFQSLRHWMDNPHLPDGTFIGGMTTGMAIVAFLGLARHIRKRGTAAA